MRKAVRRKRISRVEDVVLTGGGGTDMRVGIEAAEKANPSGAVTIILPDGDTPWPAAPPSRPVGVRHHRQRQGRQPLTRLAGR